MQTKVGSQCLCEKQSTLYPGAPVQRKANLRGRDILQNVNKASQVWFQSTLTGCSVIALWRGF